MTPMEREEIRALWQQRLDAAFPDGANCFMGDDAIQCPRPVVRTVSEDGTPELEVWTPATTLSLLAQLGAHIEEHRDSGAIIWHVPHPTAMIVMSSVIPPPLQAILAPYRNRAAEEPIA